MSRKWVAIAATLAMVLSTSAFAQSPPNSDETMTPNAPIQPADEGPAGAGTAAGTSAAAGFALGTTAIVAIGVVAAAAAVCLAACSGSGGNTSTTTTTSPK
jgi:hypothetical protein